MNKVMTTVLLVLALGAGWLIGSQSSARRSSDATDSELLTLQEENDRLRRALGERGPTLEPIIGLGVRPKDQPKGEPSGGASGEAVKIPKVETFDISAFDDADKAFQALLAHAHTMLAKGPEGHLALLDTLSKNFFDKPGEKIAEQLMGGEEGAARYLYPLIRFAMNHDAQVVDMTETIFKTMAEDPQRFSEIDNDPLELFSEGVAYMLPGMVDNKRLERLRGYAKTILETPEAKQPRSVQRQRRDIQKALASWAPAVTADEAIRRLQEGTDSPEEAMMLLKRLSPSDLSRFDFDAVVGPLIESHGWQAISLVSRLKPDEGTLAKIDERVVIGVGNGKIRQSLLSYYLRFTNRWSWTKARGFLESGMQRSAGESAGAFLMVALSMKPGPDEDWIDWAERTYTFSNRVRAFLKKRRNKRDGG